MVLEKTLESSFDCKEIQPIHSEGDQPWEFFRRNDAKAEASVLWPPHASHRWEAVNNHMHGCESLDKPGKQARMLTEGV